MNNYKTFSLCNIIKFITKILLFTLIPFTFINPQTHLILPNYSSIDSTLTTNIDSIRVTNSITFGKVAAQFLGGTLTGIIGLVFTARIYRPISAGVGYILGSSLGVYVIGNIGSNKGNFWWTLAGGSATALLFIIPLDKSGDSWSATSIIMGGILATLSAEILTYHLTKPKINVSENVSINFLDGSDSPFNVSNELKRISKYDVVYPMVGIKISF